MNFFDAGSSADNEIIIWSLFSLYVIHTGETNINNEAKIREVYESKQEFVFFVCIIFFGDTYRNFHTLNIPT